MLERASTSDTSHLKINDGKLYKAVILSSATFPLTRYCLHNRKRKKNNKLAICPDEMWHVMPFYKQIMLQY